MFGNRNLTTRFGCTTHAPPVSVSFNACSAASATNDGSISGAPPQAVVLPATTREVQQVVRLASLFDVPLVSRGAGTGLSGGAVTLHGGIAMQMSRMRGLRVDALTRTAMVEPGVVNWDLQQAAARHGLFYAPDPSSQKGCTLGGNCQYDGSSHTEPNYAISTVLITYR